MILPFAPDWSSPFIESRSYETTVLTRLDGSEQRRQLRSKARRTWDFTVSAGDAIDAQLLERTLQALYDATVYAPFAPHGTPLLAGATATATFSLDTSSRDFRVGGYILVGLAEALVITATTASTVVTGIASTGTYTAGSVVYPTWPGKLDRSPTLDRAARGATTLRLQIRLDPTALPAGTGSAGTTAAAIAFGTVVPDRPGRTDDLLRDLQRFEPSRGGFVDAFPEDEPRFRFAFRTIFDGLDLAAAFWTWYDGVLGSLNPSWVPSWQEDLTLVANVGSGATSMTVSTAVLNLTNPNRTHVALIRHEGSMVIRIVTNVATVGATEVLTLDSAPGFTLSANTMHLAAWARYARLDADEVGMTWHRPGLAEVSLSFVEIPR